MVSAIKIQLKSQYVWANSLLINWLLKLCNAYEKWKFHNVGSLNRTISPNANKTYAWNRNEQEKNTHTPKTNTPKRKTVATMFSDNLNAFGFGKFIKSAGVTFRWPKPALVSLCGIRGKSTCALAFNMPTQNNFFFTVHVSTGKWCVSLHTLW